MQSCLGLSFDPVARRVIFDQPTLPRFIDRLILRGLTIGDARLDVMFRRSREDVALSVLAPPRGHPRDGHQLIPD